MKLKTKELQDVVSRVSKGVGNNKLIPLTSLINITSSEGTVFLTTTDATNYFTVQLMAIEGGQDFEVSVNADMFVKLVQKMTSETITLEVTDSYLLVVGNGKYKIDLLLDEDGTPVKFPDKSVDLDSPTGTVSLDDVKKVIANNKASLSVSTEIPCLMNYYVADSVLTTDRYKICDTDVNLFNGEPLLLSPTTMELLAIIPGDKADFYRTADAIIFDNEYAFLYAPIIEGIEKVPIDAIKGLLSQEFKSTCSLKKEAILSVLDRLSIFVGPYDKNTVYMEFVDNGIKISSKQSNGSELVEYTSVTEYQHYKCAIDIEMLKSQIQSVSLETFDLYFGSDVAVMISDTGVTKIVALQED